MTSLTTVDLAIGELTGGGYAVVAGDPAAPDACGELSGQGDDVYVAVSARADSNLGGVAWLHASDYRTRVSLFVGENLNRAPSGSPNDDGSGAPEPPADETPVPTATPRASASQPAGKTKTYTSPTFGYTVTYDAGVWEITVKSLLATTNGARVTL